MTDRSSRWAFTAYEDQWHFLETIPDLVAEWGWQDEVCPETGRKHKQGYLRTHSQQRLSALVKVLPGIHLEPARDWNKLVNYCKKSESRALDGEQVHQVNPREYLTLDKALTRLANVFDLEAFKRDYIDPDSNGKKVMKKYFEKAVCELVRENPADIGYYVRPDVERGWNIAYSVFLEKRQTDRQTVLRLPAQYSPTPSLESLDTSIAENVDS